MRLLQEVSSEESSVDDENEDGESPTRRSEGDEDMNDFGWRPCSSEWEVYKGRQFHHVCTREEFFIEENRRMRQAGFPEPALSSKRFSVALSGGGVRAAAFAAGVLWRLADQGRLKDVDHIAAVSGGSYVAAAFASHLAEMTQEDEAHLPTSGRELDTLYRRAMARTITRMQRNTPYLARDLGKDPFAIPNDGSSCLPRVFDIPIMVAVFSFAVLARTLMLALLVVLPLVEVVDTLYGADMRMNFCADVFAPRLVLVTLLGVSTLELNLGVVLLALFCVFALHCLLQVMRTRQHEKNAHLWLSLRSLISVAMRTVVGWLILTGLICGPVNWRFHRYQVNGATDLRLCQCRDFILQTSALPCSDRRWQQQLGPSSNLHHQFGYLDWLKEHPQICANLTESEAYRLDLFPELFHRGLAASLFPQGMLLLLMALLLAVLLLPILPDAFVWTFNIAGPLTFFLVTFFLIQWRVLSPVTHERLYALGEETTKEVRGWWSVTIKAILVVDMLLVCGFKRVRNAAHAFYAQSMRKAWYASGEEWTWGDIRQTPFCPYLIFCTTVNDYMRLGDESPLAEFAFGTLYTGGERTGYRRTWKNQSLSKSSALSGGALDGFVLGFHDSLSFRFWLEFLGVHMGSFIRFRRSHAPPTVTKLPGIVVFVIIYGLLLLGVCLGDSRDLQQCRQARNLVLVAIVTAAAFVLISFFDFLTCLAPLHHSHVVRSIHQATQFYHQSQEPPSVVYLSDGGVLDNTGIVQLMRRRCKRILSVYAEDDMGDVFCSLKEVFRITEQERLGSFYNPLDPRRNVWHTVLDYVEDPDLTYLHLSIRYGSTAEEEGEGQLLLVKNRMPSSMAGEPVRELLTEEELLGHTRPAGPHEHLGSLHAAELGGCCCDGCHGTMWDKCCGTFPTPPTANQWLTPQYFSSLCRLGHTLSAQALAEVDTVC